MKKAIVLNSGGIDSTTCVSIAVNKYGVNNVATVSVFYGQRLDKEIEGARKIAKYYGLKHYELNLAELYKFSDCTLLKTGEKVIKKSYSEQVKELKEGHITSYVPFRNGAMISAVAALAIGLYPKDKVDIFLGAHASDWAYADCSKDFLNKMNEAVQAGTYGNISLVAPLADMTKTQVVARGIELKTPYQYTWSCYEGGKKPCGKCGSCIDRAAAFKANGIKDPALED